MVTCIQIHIEVQRNVNLPPHRGSPPHRNQRRSSKSVKKRLQEFKNAVGVFPYALQSEGKGYCESRYLEVVAEMQLAIVTLLSSIRSILIALLCFCLGGLLTKFFSFICGL